MVHAKLKQLLPGKALLVPKALLAYKYQLRLALKNKFSC